VQKDALTIAIESHRLSMPKCSGTLFWQLNDCWPVTSWSVLDYYLRPKAAWFSLKRLFAPIMVGEGGSAGNPVAMLVSDYPLDSCFLSLTGYSKGTRV
ncbi:MAG TPA: glycoside hydrolase family 2 protein, partial [Bacteroidales bacterium]|nr:glycoside hydrolase family 2 protein [Bacteroidales bacterium]